VCCHPDSEATDTALLAGRSHCSLAREHGRGRSAVGRHAHNPLAIAVAGATAVMGVGSADRVLGELLRLKGQAARKGERAEREGSHGVALAATRGQVRIVELLLQAADEANAEQTTTVTQVKLVWPEDVAGR